MAVKRPGIPLNEVIIVALDSETSTSALSTFNMLKGHAGYFKVGLKTYLAGGEKLVKKIKSAGCKVFLDLKFHDIPDQTASAARLMVRMGVDMFTVHASGGPEMLSAVAEAVKTEAKSLRVKPPIVLAVTVLTSIQDQTSKQIFHKKASEKVLSFYNMAAASGMSGIVCSPLELGILPTGTPDRPRLIRVTPGIRASETTSQKGTTAPDDQARTSTPASAITAGADHLVIGRPITGAKDPVEAYLSHLEEVRRARKRPN